MSIVAAVRLWPLPARVLGYPLVSSERGPHRERAAGLSDEALRALVLRDPERGWRAFIDQYTPVLLGLIERAGLASRDEAMEIYTRVCEHLADEDCARLRRHDPRKGALAAWLAVVVRHVIIDWVRSRAGRRRVFKAVRDLAAFDRRVFELYYWSEHAPPEICELLGTELGRAVPLGDVLDALQRVEAVLSERHRSDLVSMAMRSHAPIGLEDEAGRLMVDPASDRENPERLVVAKEVNRTFEAALETLPPEDVAIIRLRFVEGLTLPQIRRALHLERLAEDRVSAILAAVRKRLERTAGGADGLAPSDLAFLEGRPE